MNPNAAKVPFAKEMIVATIANAPPDSIAITVSSGPAMPDAGDLDSFSFGVKGSFDNEASDEFPSGGTSANGGRTLKTDNSKATLPENG